MSTKPIALAAFSVLCLAACEFDELVEVLSQSELTAPTPRGIALPHEASAGFVVDGDGSVLRFFDPDGSGLTGAFGMWSGWDIAALAPSPEAPDTAWALHETGILIAWTPDGYVDYRWLPSSSVTTWCDLAVGPDTLWVTGVQSDGQTRLFHHDGSSWSSKTIGSPPSCVALDYDAEAKQAAALFDLGGSHAVITYDGLGLATAHALPTSVSSPTLHDLVSEAGIVAVVGHGGSPIEPADLPFIELVVPSTGEVVDYAIVDSHDALGVALASDHGEAAVLVVGEPLSRGTSVFGTRLVE